MLTTTLSSSCSVHGFKSIGYVAFVSAEPVYSSDYVRERQKQKQSRSVKAKAEEAEEPPPNFMMQTAIIGVLVLAAAFAIPYLSSSSLPRSS
jgi:hypothetical protein